VNEPLTYLLDTNVVSEMMRPNPEPKVVVCIDAIAGEGIALASITVWEILDGVGRLQPSRRREELAERFQGILEDLFEERVLNWTLADARACARVMEKKRRRGEPLDDHLPDAMLAGMALSRGLTLITRNRREFRNTGVPVIDPWTRAQT
jgi:predicted nucleic acid-binding protein